METYKWAVNQLKLQRAIANSHGGDEETIKKLYVSYGGLIGKGYETEASFVPPAMPEIKEPPMREGDTVVRVIEKVKRAVTKKNAQ